MKTDTKASATYHLEDFLVCTHARFLRARSDPDARQSPVPEILQPILQFLLLLLCR
jgi:hypothetical protein